MNAKNQYYTWSFEEDKKLIDLYYLGLSLNWICLYLSRTPKGVSARLRRLGIIEARKEFTQYHW